MNDIPNDYGPWETPTIIGYCVFCQEHKLNGEVWKTIPDEFAFTCLGNMMTEEIKKTKVPLVMCKECKKETDLKSERIVNYWDDFPPSSQG